MDEELFENLLESVREAGALLRGKREADRTTTLSEEANVDGPSEVVERVLADLGST